MNHSSHSSGTTRRNGMAILLVAVVLGWLWRESIVSALMAFSNDAPLGLMTAYSEFRWGNLMGGSWVPLVWLGSPALPLQPSFTNLTYLVLGPILFGKFIAPLSLLLLGVSAFIFGRSQGFARPVCILVGLAAALNTNFVSHAGWGLGARAVTLGFTLLALAALSQVDRRRFWARALLAGISVGFAVVEGADVGAIFSLFVAAYALYAGWIELSAEPGRRALLVVGRLAVIAGCAAWIASYALTSLVGTQIQGVAIMGEGAAAKQQRWGFVTGWSFPKLETVRIAVPGIMGYRLDTPEGGAYWGNVGQDGTPAGRHNGGGEYAGVLVLLLSGWAVARAASKKGRQPFTDRERKLIGFWAVVSLVSLLLAFGRFAPFYQLVYSLPYLSTIRMPMKFLHVMHLGLLVLFAYGLQGQWRLYVEAPGSRNGGVIDQVKAWWRDAIGFDRLWSRALLIVSGGAVLLALVYAACLPSVAAYIAGAGFTVEEGKGMAGFSVFQVVLFAIFVAVNAGLLAVLASGRFAGGRSGVPAWLLGGVLVVDLARAATPFILHYDYLRRYESNPVVAFLATKPWEHRVTARIFPNIGQTLTAPEDGTWPAVQNQWMEQQFPYNTIHTADIWQMPRMPELDSAYMKVFRPAGPGDLGRIGRMWQLDNVRYVIGSRGMVAELNRQFDPAKQSFKPVLGFDLVPKPGSPPGERVTLDDITAVANPAGQYAVIEYGGALPRALLLSRWDVIPDDTAALKTLQSPAFDPATTVVLDAPPVLAGGNPLATNSSAVASASEATITEWAPKRVAIRTSSTGDAVLLLNDRWDPNWHATVDGKPAVILRANFLMRGVAVSSGQHEVVFSYTPSMRMLWVTLSAIAAALAAGFWLALGTRGSTPAGDGSVDGGAPGSGRQVRRKEEPSTDPSGPAGSTTSGRR